MSHYSLYRNSNAPLHALRFYLELFCIANDMNPYYGTNPSTRIVFPHNKHPESLDNPNPWIWWQDFIMYQQQLDPIEFDESLVDKALELIRAQDQDTKMLGVKIIGSMDPLYCNTIIEKIQSVYNYNVKHPV